MVRVGDDIGGQELVAGMVLPGYDDGVSDSGMSGQDGFDFSQFDAEAADLDLVVETAEVLDIAVGLIASQVAGLVEAGAGLRSEWVGNESVGGQFGAMEIALGQAVAADIHFARDADGHRLQVRVEDVDLQVGDGNADEAGCGFQIGRGEGAIGDMDGGFSDAIHVD